MHEQRIISQVVDAATLAGATKKIIVEVGELSTITPLHLKEHLAGRVDWEVETRFKKARVKCACKYKGVPEILEEGHDFILFRCPVCKGKPRVIEGGEIKIIGVE
jgi:Zn finger protein HypA/HybF involved in hydrogenase expression